MLCMRRLIASCQTCCFFPISSLLTVDLDFSYTVDVKPVNLTGMRTKAVAKTPRCTFFVSQTQQTKLK